MNPDLHAMAFSIVGDHARAQQAVERAFSAYALKFQHLGFSEHPWTTEIHDIAQWSERHRFELMDQLWDVLKRENQLASVGFFALGATERVALYLRARTPLELEDIARILQISTSDTVALLERARNELLDRNAPGLLVEPQGYKCRHTMRAQALAALDVDRFNDDFLVRHMRECPECTDRYTQAKKNRDAWLAFIPEGTIPREVQRDFEERFPKMMASILPQNHRSPKVMMKRFGRGGMMAFSDLFKAMQKPSFLVTVATVAVFTWIVWVKR